MIYFLKRWVWESPFHRWVYIWVWAFHSLSVPMCLSWTELEVDVGWTASHEAFVCKTQAFCLRLRQRQCWTDVREVLLFFTFKTMWRIFREANVGSDFNPRMWLWTSSGIRWDTVAEISLLGSENCGRQDYWCRLGWKRDIGFPISHESPNLTNPSLITPKPHELPWNSCIIKQYCLPKYQMIAYQACKTFFLGGG